MLKIESLDKSITENFRIVALVQGDSGAGKTHFSSTFPSPVFIDCDDKIQGAIEGDIRVIKLCNVIEPMFIQESEAAIQMCIMDKWCKTIILDSLSTYCDMLMVNIQIVSRSIGKIPTQHDYGTQISKIRKMIYDLRHSGKNVVMTCHINISKNDRTGIWRGLPLVTGKLSEKIQGLFQENYRLFVDTVDGKSVFKLKAVSDDIFSAASLILLEKFKPEIIDPSYLKIIQSSRYASLLSKSE